MGAFIKANANFDKMEICKIGTECFMEILIFTVCRSYIDLKLQSQRQITKCNNNKIFHNSYCRYKN